LGKITRFPPRETIRATVVGAGSHITEISGSTIEYDPVILPIKNIPILKLEYEEEEPSVIAAAIRRKLDWFRLDGELQLVAIAFCGQKSPSFNHVGALADAVLNGAKPLLDKGLPLITVSRNDLAKVLGQSIRARIAGHKGFVCIDAIRVEGGDYIDIGAPAAGGTVLPVVIKTLLFK
jgi:ethanolamine utilization protein EutA